MADFHVDSGMNSHVFYTKICGNSIWKPHSIICNGKPCCNLYSTDLKSQKKKVSLIDGETALGIQDADQPH